MSEEQLPATSTSVHFKKPHFYIWLVVILVVCAGVYVAYASYIGKVIDPTSSQTAVTTPVLNPPSSLADKLVYTDGAYLYEYDPATMSSSTIAVPYNEYNIQNSSSSLYTLDDTIDPLGRIFFFAASEMNGSVDVNLYRFDINSNRLTTLMSGANLNVDSISPNEEFATIDEGTSPLRTKTIISLSTNKPLYSFDTPDFEQVWSPDSKYLAYNEPGEDLFGAVGSDASLQSVVLFDTSTNSTTTILASSNSASSTTDYVALTWKSPSVLIYQQNIYQGPFIIPPDGQEISEEYTSKGDKILENPEKQYYEINIMTGEKTLLPGYVPPTFAMLNNSESKSPSGKWMLNKAFNASSTEYYNEWNYSISNGSTTISIPAVGPYAAAWIK